MDILNTKSLKCNKQIKIKFNGGDLSSDAGLLLIKEFATKIGFVRLVKKIFKTTDTSFRFHRDDENLMQMMIYQIIAAYFEYNCADELRNDPVFQTILGKIHWLRSQHSQYFSAGWTKMHLPNLMPLTKICGISFTQSKGQNT